MSTIFPCHDDHSPLSRYISTAFESPVRNTAGPVAPTMQATTTAKTERKLVRATTRRFANVLSIRTGTNAGLSITVSYERCNHSLKNPSVRSGTWAPAIFAPGSAPRREFLL